MARRLFRRGQSSGGSSDEWNNSSVDDDSALGLGSAGGGGGASNQSDPVTAHQKRGGRRIGNRFRRRLVKSSDDVASDDGNTDHLPRKVNFQSQTKLMIADDIPMQITRSRLNSTESSLGAGGHHSDANSRLSKLRYRLNPFKKHSKSVDDMDSLGLHSADEAARPKEGRRRGSDTMTPSAIRNWRKRGGTGGSIPSNDPPIRKISFDSGDPAPTAVSAVSHSPYATGGDMLSYVAGAAAAAAASAAALPSVQGQPRGRRARYSIYHGNKTVKKKFRVRPYHCFNEPLQLTEEEIYADSTQPSVFYESLKSYLHPSTKAKTNCQVPEAVREVFGTPSYDGRIGALRAEVLGCVSLDRQKPDVCVYMVSGDTAFSTDIIHGFRSPMWPSESKRAAVFPLHHAYTSLYVGVFDVKSRKNKENDVFCGRAMIDVATLRPNTEYDITLPLRHSTFAYDRKKRGVIRVRFSLHWFTERGAVLSYFKSPASLLRTNPLVAGSPTIPCADPKTFRNVACTVYGSDLPGKYSRTAFRATVREFNLYQVNAQFLVRTFVLDAILYGKPFLSMYLFIGGLYIVWMEAVRLVPPYMLTYLLILYVENYYHYVVNTDYNEGYRQLTILEVFYGLIFNAMDGPVRYFQPVMVDKKAKKRGNQRNQGGRNLRRIHSIHSLDGMDKIDAATPDDEAAPMDHREFPFSEGNAYPKFGVEDSLAPSKAGGGTTRLHGRLSVYYASAPAMEQASPDDQADEGDDDSTDRSDDETVVTTTGMGDTLFGMDDLDDDLEDDGLDMPQDADANATYGYGEDPQGTSTRPKSKPRIHAGPIQNNDIAGSKIPPQVTLKRIEGRMHRWSKQIAVEVVAAPPMVSAEQGSGGTKKSEESSEHEHETMTQTALKKSKAPQDEFDRLLGLEFRSANPVNRILSSFLGPMMRILRISIYVVRIAFNVSTWRDPFLSFWTFVAMVGFLILLLVFPWRLFFFLTTIVGLGPQNILVRRYLEKRAERMVEEKRQEAAKTSTNNSFENISSHGSNMSTGSGDNKRGGFFGRRAGRRGKRPSIDNMPVMTGERPAFSSDMQGQSSAKKLSPRSIAIPYSRLRKERFYDWPPDPTVSRATPLDLFAPPPPPTDVDIDDYDLPSPGYEFKEDSGLRQRRAPDDFRRGDGAQQPSMDDYGYE